MALNIRQGDVLVVGTKEYPILFCGEFSHESGSTASMKKMCRVTASTKRRPAVVSGKRGDPVTQIVSMKCTPLDPASAYARELVVRELPQAPINILETMVDGGDTFYTLVVEKVLK